MPPANDNFASATTILGTTYGHIDGTTVGATNESGEPAAGGLVPIEANPIGVWYKFTPSSTDVYHFNLFEWSDTAPYGDLWSGTSLGSLTFVDWLQHANKAIYNVTLNSGTTYYLRVYARRISGVPQLGTFTVMWCNNDVPANNNFANAQTITGTSGTLDSFIGNATMESGEPNHTSAGGGAATTFRSVWYKMTASSTRTQGFDILDHGSDTVLTTIQVYTGSAVNALTQVSRPSFSGSVWRTAVTVDMISGTDYYICVAYNIYSGTTTAPPPFTLTWGLPPTNDPWSGATGIGQVFGGGTIDSYDSTTKYETGHLSLPTSWKYCTIETNDPDRGIGTSPPGYSSRTIWYKFTTQAKGLLRIMQHEPVYDRSFQFKTTGVYQGSSLAALTRVSYTEFPNSTDFDDTIIGQLDAGVAASQTYYIAVGDDDTVPTPESPILYWEFIPDSLWDGEWGDPPLATPDPGTTTGGAISWTTIWNKFRSTIGINAAPYYSGSPIEWYTPSDNDYEATIGTDGLTLQPTLSGGYGSISYSESGTFGLPTANMEWTIGFHVDGLKWVNTSNDSGSGGRFESSERICGWLSIQPYNRSPTLFVGRPTGGLNNGWAIANGVKYRVKFTYSPSTTTWRCYLYSYPTDPGILLDELTSYTPSNTSNAVYGFDLYTTYPNLDNSLWSITFEGWSAAPVVSPQYFYYKDAAWHYLGAEADRDTFVFRGGSWVRA